MKNPLPVFSILFVVGCTAFPVDTPVTRMTAVDAPAIEVDPENGHQSTRISILIYNIEGLPWPVRRKRTKPIRDIGFSLGAMRDASIEPDIVLLQEAFTSKSEPVPIFGGYPNIVGGPKRTDRATNYSGEVAPEFLQERRFWKGERAGKRLSSGLAILSNYPIIKTTTRPFQHFACAGFDCLANKGVMLAVIQIPGVPEPIRVFNTHMNSNRASGVSAERALTAYSMQVKEVQDFIQTGAATGQSVLILGGDFNTKSDIRRLENLSAGNLKPIVRYYCTRMVDDCDLAISFDGDAPWEDTQDLQAFYPGSKIDIRPIRIEALFDEPVNGHKLSDHDGYLVTYRLSWNPADFPASVQ